MDSVTLGIIRTDDSALVYIADDQGYFAANGLNATVKSYPNGAAAVTGMLNGETDISTASEFVLVTEAMQNASICTFGTMGRSSALYVVARTDRGISSISNLKGKTVGVTLGTNAQFYLGRFLELNGISQREVSLVNVSFTDGPNALANSTGLEMIEKNID